MGRLPKLSSLSVVISCEPFWREHDNPLGAVQHIRWATAILDQVGRDRPGDLRVHFKLSTITNFGCYLSQQDGLAREACKMLEEVLLTFPVSHVQFHPPEPEQRRAGRAEFWSPIITAGFPRLNDRRLLLLPRCKLDSVRSRHN